MDTVTDLYYCEEEKTFEYVLLFTSFMLTISMVFIIYGLTFGYVLLLFSCSMCIIVIVYYGIYKRYLCGGTRKNNNENRFEDEIYISLN
jgi:hypothetical protein